VFILFGSLAHTEFDSPNSAANLFSKRNDKQFFFFLLEKNTPIPFFFIEETVPIPFFLSAKM